MRTPRAATTGRRAWFLTVPLAAAAVLLTAAAQWGQSVQGWQIALAVVFLAAFVAAEFVVLVFEVRRQAFAASIIELPLLLGLFFLSPALLVLARASAALIARAYQRQVKIKLWFNVASLAAGAACATLIVRAGPPLVGTDPVTWLLLAAAVGVNIVVTFGAVAGVVSLVQGRVSGSQLAQMVLPSLPVAAANVALALVVLVLLKQTPWALILLAALAAIFVVSYRFYARSIRQSRALAEMYRLTRVLADTPHDGTLADVLLGRVREMLQAEYATLWLPARGRHPEVLLSARVDDHALLDVAATPEALRMRAFTTGETVAVGPRQGDEGLRRMLRESGAKDAVVVPLRAGSAVIGCLEVAGRVGDFTHFSGGDVRLLETIAAHAAVAVENSRLVDRLRFDAYHDALTGLPNRRRVSNGLEESVAVRPLGEVVAVLLFDVDELRGVNESLGHAAGDQLLAQLADRLRTAAPSSALVGRVGGDEFVVTLRLPSSEAAVRLAGALRSEVRRPMPVGSLKLDVDVAVGVAVHPDHGSDPATLLQRADVASRAARSLAGGVQLFNSALESRSARRLGIAPDLRQAIERGQLEVYFQPKVALSDRRLVGVECLARWQHPAHGLVAPEDFVAVAEHTGLLSRLTEAVLVDGLRRCRQWSDDGHPLPIAVNISSRTLVDPGFPARVAALLDEHGVAPELLTFELTEDRLLGETERPMPILRSLAELGVGLAVDDFGTRYSSLSYLRRLPLHEVKIDKSFVQGMATDAGDLAIVRAVVDLARDFGLRVVAEGVESELTLELLLELGCDVGQGFLFSRPLPYERLEAWFTARTEAEASPAGAVRRLRAVG